MELLEEIKANKLSPNQIKELADRMRINGINYPEWRLGQLIFNSIFEVKPKLANLIRATIYDPYYVMNEDKALDLMILFTKPQNYK